MQSGRNFFVMSRDYRAESKQYHRSLRLQVITAYGGRCECCGESRRDFLSLDHKNNDGAHERRKINGSNSGCSNRVWQILRKAGWPKGNYRLLCYNCNLGRQRNWEHPGICPHELERGEIVSVRLDVSHRYFFDTSQQLEMSWLGGYKPVGAP